MTVYLTGYCTEKNLEEIKQKLKMVGWNYYDETVQDLEKWYSMNEQIDRGDLKDRFSKLLNSNMFYIVPGSYGILYELKNLSEEFEIFAMETMISRRLGILDADFYHPLGGEQNV